MDVVRTRGHMPEVWRPAFDELLAQDLDESDLTTLLYFAGHENVGEVIRRLLDLNPTADQLSDAVLFTRDEETKRRVSRRILDGDAPNSALKIVLTDVDDDALVEEAMGRWDESDPVDYLTYVLRYSTNERVTAHFWEMLLTCEWRTSGNVSYVMNFTELQSLKDRAAEALMGMDPTLDHLSYVAVKCSVESIVVEACDQLLARKATDSFHLLSVVEKHPSQEVRNDVARRLLKYKPTSPKLKKFGADTVYARILCHSDDPAICDDAWTKMVETGVFSEYQFQLVAERATFEVHRRAAQKVLATNEHG